MQIVLYIDREIRKKGKSHIVEIKHTSKNSATVFIKEEEELKASNYIFT